MQYPQKNHTGVQCISMLKFGIFAVLFTVTAVIGCSSGQVSGKTNPSYTGNETAPKPSSAYPPIGFTTFPYAFTVEAIDKTHEISRENGGIYAIHRDNGIPWYEALNNLPYPKKVQETWQDYKNRRPKGVPVYLGLGPLAEDRVNLIHSHEGSKKSKIFKGKKLDDPEVIKAYTNYVMKAIDTLEPDFLNLGIEAGELAARKPREWARFNTLYTAVARKVKEKHPDIQVGISFGLQSLLDEGVLEKCQSLINNSDYIGISFYPYMSQFHERYGSAALPAPPQQWRAPLERLKALVNKPIAICETGYTSKLVSVPKHKLSMNGSEALQNQYLQELADFASRDNYLFVVWFLPVDYDRLFESIPKGDGVYLIWQNIGMFDKNLKPKAAWKTWTAIQKGTRAVNVIASEPVTTQKPPMKEPVKPSVSTGKGLTFDFENGKSAFQKSPSDKLSIQKLSGAASFTGTQFMQWSYSYKKNRPQYIAKEFDKGTLSGKKSFSIHIKSDRSDPIILQLEEINGEAFYVVLEPSTTWELVTFSFDEFTVSPEKRKDGTLTAKKVSKIIFADIGAQSDGASGKRTVDIGPIIFN